MKEPYDPSDEGQEPLSDAEIEMLQGMYAKGLLPQNQNLDQPLVLPNPIAKRVDRICIKRHRRIDQLFWETFRSRAQGEKLDWLCNQALAYMGNRKGYKWPPDPLDCMLIGGFPHIVSWLVGKRGFKPPPPETPS
jgi:hypothetical protein